jgi:hypothetical protein
VKSKLAEARLFRRGAVNLSEEVLESTKSSCFEPQSSFDEQGYRDFRDIRNLTGFLRELKAMGTSEVQIVQELDWWRAHAPELTQALVRAGRVQERRESRALRAFLSPYFQQVAEGRSAA